MQKPKFVLSRKKLLEQYQKVREISDIVSYSSKTNQEVTKILEKETDSMFSVHLANELKYISDKSRVIFLAQAWNNAQIDALIKQGIRYFVVDNESDLQVIVSYLKEKEVKINLLLRLKLKENTIRTEKYFVFGMDSETVVRWIQVLRENKNIDKLGVHFHRKTQNMSEWDLEYELSNIFSGDILRSIDIINIGGGIPAEYANTNVDVISSILKKIAELRTWLGKYNISMIIEPGRFIAAPAVQLLTHVIAVYSDTIILDVSVYNTDMDAIIVPVKLKVEGELQKGRQYKIKGCTPCSMDIFRYRVFLDGPKVGDTLILVNAGAYNFSSDFCDLEKLETEIVD